jgi:hypothetical protein
MAQPSDWPFLTVDPMTAAGFASDFGIKIYTIGMAGSGGVTNQGFFSQRIPPLNDRLLKSISEKTGGRFYMNWYEEYFLYILIAFISAMLGFLLKYIFWRTV